jgi:NAD+ diphosphatase
MIAFTGAELDRAPADRATPAWLAARRSEPGTATLQVCERGVWIKDGRLALRTAEDADVFLGLNGERALFAADVTGREPGRGSVATLREAATVLPAGEAALAAYAASLMSWHRRHRFCANCGAATEAADAGHERRCPRCHAHHFPRTDPVVIVRVTDERDRILLGRSPSWPPGRYSVLAGFVEPGETLEEAVRREVLEESGVEVGAVEYVASQPWPFPSSLMLGFSALAARGEPVADDDELEDVRFFERDEVVEAAAGRSALQLSPRYSISRRLLDDWLAAGQPRSGRSG